MGTNDGPNSRIIEYHGKEDHKKDRCGIFVNGEPIVMSSGDSCILDYSKTKMKYERA